MANVTLSSTKFSIIFFALFITQLSFIDLQDALLVVLEPDSCRFAIGRVSETNDEQFLLALAGQSLTQAFHVLCSVNIEQLHCGRVRTQSEAFVEFANNTLHLHELHDAIVVHVGNLVVFILAEVRAWQNLANVQEIEALQANWSHPFLVIHVVELVKAFTLVINLDPSVVCQVSEDLIFRLQSELVPKLATRLGTEDVMLSLFAGSCLE